MKKIRKNVNNRQLFEREKMMEEKLYTDNLNKAETYKEKYSNIARLLCYLFQSIGKKQFLIYLSGCMH